MQELIKNIEQWAIDRGIDKQGTVEGQLIKTAEEMAELIIGISKNDVNLIKDSIGDVFVTLVIGNMLDEKHDFKEFTKTKKNTRKFCECKKTDKIFNLFSDTKDLFEDGGYDYGTLKGMYRSLICIASTYNLTLKECVQFAYDEIKGRNGAILNGVFVKEGDL